MKKPLEPNIVIYTRLFLLHRLIVATLTTFSTCCIPTKGEFGPAQMGRGEGGVLGGVTVIDR